MTGSDSRTRRVALSGALLLALTAGCGAAQAQPPTPVRYTVAREHEVRRSIRLSGTIKSPTSSVVASEVAGLVIAIEVREGDRVSRGQPLARLRPRWNELRLREARGRLQEARARLELAESKLTRARDLFASEVISQQDLDDAVSEFTAWEGREVQSRAEVDRLEFTMERLVIRAPFAGAVVRKLTDLGEWVELGGEVFELVALDHLEVRLDAPERYYRELHLGFPATVGFEAIPDLRLEGRVSAIVPSADLQARTFPIKVALSSLDDRIGVGMLAGVDLAVGEWTTALIVPKDAVVRQGAGETVFRIDPEGTVEPVSVRSGQGVGSWIVVGGPLAVGDRVVTRGNERLRPGQAVEGTVIEYPAP